MNEEVELSEMQVLVVYSFVMLLATMCRRSLSADIYSQCDGQLSVIKLVAGRVMREKPILSCPIIVGVPIMSISWFQSVFPEDDGTRINTSIDDSLSAVQFSLSFENLSSGHEGLYHCSVNDRPATAVGCVFVLGRAAFQACHGTGDCEVQISAVQGETVTLDASVEFLNGGCVENEDIDRLEVITRRGSCSLLGSCTDVRLSVNRNTSQNKYMLSMSNLTRHDNGTQLIVSMRSSAPAQRIEYRTNLTFHLIVNESPKSPTTLSSTTTPMTDAGDYLTSSFSTNTLKPTLSTNTQPLSTSEATQQTIPTTLPETAQPLKNQESVKMLLYVLIPSTVAVIGVIMLAVVFMVVYMRTSTFSRRKRKPSEDCQTECTESDIVSNVNGNPQVAVVGLRMNTLAVKALELDGKLFVRRDTKNGGAGEFCFEDRWHHNTDHTGQGIVAEDDRGHEDGRGHEVIDYVRGQQVFACGSGVISSEIAEDCESYTSFDSSTIYYSNLNLSTALERGLAHV